MLLARIIIPIVNTTDAVAGEVAVHEQGVEQCHGRASHVGALPST
jgi:hypothetical protein